MLGLAGLFQWQGDVITGCADVLTSGGVLVFNDGESDGSFSAEGVPLPSAVWLLGSALVAGAVLRRRQV